MPAELVVGLRRTAPLVLLLLLAIEAPQLLFGQHGHIDLEVYRAGGSAALHGRALYGAGFAAGTPLHLAFTYPPAGGGGPGAPRANPRRGCRCAVARR